MLGRIRMELAVGIIFLAAMAILGYYTIIMTSRFMEPEGTYYMTVTFPTTEGLEISSKVKVNGVEAGAVKEMRLVGYQVQVKLRLNYPFTLYKNYLIKIKNETLLGKKAVSIFTGTPLDRDGRSNEVVTARQNLPGTYEDVIATVSEIVEENRPNIFASIRNIKDITDKINAGQGTLGKLVNQDGIHAQSEELVKELRETIEDAREQAPITSFIRAALTAF